MYENDVMQMSPRQHTLQQQLSLKGGRTAPWASSPEREY